MSTTRAFTPVPSIPAALPPSPDRERLSVVWVLVVGATLIRAAGFSFPFLSYRLAELHFSAQGVSVVLALFGVGWLAGQILLGRAADALGRRSTLVGAMVLAALALPVLAEAATPVTVAAAAVVAGLVYDAPRPVISAVVADYVPDDVTRTRIAGWRHFGINVGAAITGGAGGLLVDITGLSALFWINAGACALFALGALRYLPADQPKPTAPTDTGNLRTALRDLRLWMLWCASFTALIPVAGLFSILPLLMTDAELPASAYGWTQVASACAVLVPSVPLNAWLARRAARGASLVPLLAVSALILGLGLGSAGFATTTLGYVLAACVGIPGEIILFVTATMILDRLAPAHARGLYAGIWGATLAAAVICAPLIAGWSLTHGGPHLVAAMTALCGLLGAALCVPLAALMRHEPSLPTAPA
ncbi:MFS transporter [Streptomyces sp. A5-4]|uniref:MFS transporter n=1 Tax=Streptomyces sp. A5-4 TaxID=3384771 RepID=UPI003DA85DEE